MFKNYLKIAIRNLLSNKLYTFVNVFGIAVAMALCIVAYLNQSYNYMFDNFHQNADKIFRVKTVRLINGQEQKFGVVPRPLAPALAADFSGVEKSVRLTRSSAVVRIGENIFNETIMHADPFFFEMFDFPMKYGAHDGLRDKGKIILSEQMAQKYFGDENPVGKQIAVQYEDGKPRAFFVGAVAKKIPDHSSVHFDALAALDILADAGIDRPNNWADWSNAVFIQVADPAQLPTIAARMDGYIAAHNAVAPDWQIARFYFDPLRNLALNAWTENLRGDILKRAMHPAGMITPSIIAALLLLMACFNYINTAIAFSGKRLKEIGMRKVIGGTRGRLIVQFMGENFLLCALALILALGLAEIFVPVHDNMWPYFEL
ncbi:MAG: ABC transporter permease, partial [bacterium]